MTHSPPPSPAPAAAPCIVGLGASAGGMAALIEFLQACPPGAGFTCLVVQHLAPAQRSSLAALLQPHSPWPVHEARDGEAIEPGRVHVIAPGTVLTLVDGRLHAAPARGAGGGPPHPVDALFHSLAAACGSTAVGIVLSGMGSDGSEGLRAIAEHGGLALVQTPASAHFDSMPRSAAAAVGAAARQALPAQMPRLILEVRGLAAAPAEATPADDEPEVEALAGILHHVAAATGHDFSPYKASTLRRRIERRVALHGLPSTAAYRRLVAGSTQEAELLFKELLIGVTSFFRDPALWDAVRMSVLPALVAQAAARGDRRLRAWVVGCSTGEEAYTLAMLWRETLDVHPPARPLGLQIFATDLGADAVEAARRGLYPAAAVEGLSPQRLARFFVAEGGGWRVTKALRESVLFARHDVISDAPFSHLDLVCCRNLLIYFKAPLQQKVLALFHYILRPGGMLILGNSETVGRAETLYEPVDAKLRIHRRSQAPLRDATVVFPIRPAPAAAAPFEENALLDGHAPHPNSLQSLAERLLLEEVAPPSVLVDDNGDILYVAGRTGRFLEPAAGKANWNVHAMARAGLRPALAAALQRAAHEGRAVEVPGLQVDAGDTAQAVDLTVRPVRLPGHGELLLVVFRDAIATTPRRGRRGGHDAELQRAQEEVQALREEMRSSQEELQSTNEELQSTNEELQSANEELTTSKEEMQAMNEELQTVNAELMSKLEDLALAQSDLKNLLNSTQIATLFLDGRMQVRRFTEQAKQVINLRDGDIGRPLTDLTNALEYPGLLEDVATVLRTLEFRERPIRSTDGRWYAVRIMPYRNQDNVIDGSVITFVDITAAKQLEAKLRSLPPGAAGRG